MPLWIILGVAAALFVLVIVLAASFNLFSSGLPAESEKTRIVLPEDFRATDIAAVRFRPALRGYRMDEVDSVIAALSRRVTEQEAQLRALTAETE